MALICVSKLTKIGPENGLSLDRHLAIIWTNAKFIYIHSRKCIWKYRLENGGLFVSASMC